jgi:hypothetical protein
VLWDSKVAHVLFLFGGGSAEGRVSVPRGGIGIASGAKTTMSPGYKGIIRLTMCEITRRNRFLLFGACGAGYLINFSCSERAGPDSFVGFGQVTLSAEARAQNEQYLGFC